MWAPCFHWCRFDWPKSACDTRADNSRPRPDLLGGETGGDGDGAGGVGSDGASGVMLVVVV